MCRSVLLNNRKVAATFILSFSHVFAKRSADDELRSYICPWKINSVRKGLDEEVNNRITNFRNKTVSGD